MIITRTPFRITLGGGGTDLPAYYTQYGGFVLSAAIDKYMYIIINEPFDNYIRLKYSESEKVSTPQELRHVIAREALLLSGVSEKIDIVSLADIPKGTGLGSSGSYTVGLLNALYTYKKDIFPLQKIAEDACDIEINKLSYNAGKQDPYIATFGGITSFYIDTRGKVVVVYNDINSSDLKTLNNNLMMFYTGTIHSSTEILEKQVSDLSSGNKNTIESMHKIKDIGFKVLEALDSGNLDEIGILFDEHWKYKKSLSNKISKPYFDTIYDFAKENGALGGKIGGGGGSGFFIFYIPKNHKEFVKKMETTGVKYMSVTYGASGTQVTMNI